MGDPGEQETGNGKRQYVRDIFTAIAPRYDFLNHLLSLNIDRRWRRAAVSLLDWQRAPGGRYLDCCAGTLDLAATLGNATGFQGSVIGADFVQPMLVRGAGKSPRVTAVTADALELPFSDNHFDGATVGFGVRNLSDLALGLRELLRVLKPGARLVILEFTTPSWQPMRAGYFMYFRHILPLIGRLVSKHTTAYTYLPESVLNFPEPDALANRMADAGFTDVTYRRLTGGICALHCGRKAKGERRRANGRGGVVTRDSRLVTREGQTLAGESLLARLVSFVKLPHTLFALPFAFLGVLAASLHAPVTWRLVGLVALAFTCARWVAMGYNRIADREFDAKNPRTAMRELPRGTLTLTQAWASVIIAGALFFLAAWLLNPLCFFLSPLALVWVMTYSLTKRFTWWPHLWLGMSLAIAPVGGWLAITGSWSRPWWLLLAIAAAVATWVAGFDIFYALPDEAFDRDSGLRSAVVRLGQGRAILLAKVLHGITIPALALFGWGAGFGVWYFAGVAVAAVILTYEHQLVKPGDLSRLNAAFFNLNAVMSVTVFALAMLDVLL